MLVRIIVVTIFALVAARMFETCLFVDSLVATTAIVSITSIIIVIIDTATIILVVVDIVVAVVRGASYVRMFLVSKIRAFYMLFRISNLE